MTAKCGVNKKSHISKDSRKEDKDKACGNLKSSFNQIFSLPGICIVMSVNYEKSISYDKIRDFNLNCIVYYFLSIKATFKNETCPIFGPSLSKF